MRQTARRSERPVRETRRIADTRNNHRIRGLQREHISVYATRVNLSTLDMTQPSRQLDGSAMKQDPLHSLGGAMNRARWAASPSVWDRLEFCPMIPFPWNNPMTRIILFVLAFSVCGPAMCQSPLGFRTDGTGRYPDANPPLHWGTDKNVVWNIKLPKSNAIPVILGKKLFTCAEPCVLLCVNKATGEIIWQGESSFKEIALTEREKAQFEVERQQGDALNTKLSALNKESSALRKLLRGGQAVAEDDVNVFAVGDGCRRRVAAGPMKAAAPAFAGFQVSVQRGQLKFLRLDSIGLSSEIFQFLFRFILRSLAVS